jgi:hypothetical protein
MSENRVGPGSLLLIYAERITSVDVAEERSESLFLAWLSILALSIPLDGSG